jgi:hypothetical protein
MLTLGIVGFGLLWATETSCCCFGFTSEHFGPVCDDWGLPGPKAALDAFTCAPELDCFLVCQLNASFGRDCFIADWSSFQFCSGSYHCPVGDCLLTDSWLGGLHCPPSLASLLMSVVYRTGVRSMQYVIKSHQGMWRDPRSAITHFHHHPFHRRTSKPMQIFSTIRHPSLSEQL